MIRNLLFDFGGVLYDINVQTAIDEFRKIGIESKPWQPGQDKLFNLIETGAMSDEDIINHFMELSDNKAKREEVLHAFNSILLQLNLQSLNYLVQLKKNYRIFLLSNTNNIHYQKFAREILSDPATKIFFDCFEKEYYSFKLGMRKPEKNIFEYILKDTGIKSTESLFVDDTQENLDPAMALGMHTFWMKDTSLFPEMIETFELEV